MVTLSNGANAMNMMHLEESKLIDEFTMMEKLDLTYGEAIILKLLWYNGNHSTDLTSSGRSGRQHIYNMRAKLIKREITIVNLGGKCYGMPKASRDILDGMFLTASS